MSRHPLLHRCKRLEPDLPGSVDEPASEISWRKLAGATQA
jgi:hypothetical protein